ncbi:MAG: DUF7344 domain-containing protein [Halodesulfurarchaeum sp.]
MGFGTAPAVQFRGDTNYGDRDEIFDTLKNSRRRAVLEYLIREESTAEFRELVRYVAAKENETSPSEVSTAQRNRVRTALYQHHLGKLAEHGFIEYDKREGTIHLEDDAERIAPFLGATETEKTDVHDYLFGILVLGITALLVWVPAWTVGHSVVAYGVIGFAFIAYTYYRSESSFL